MDIRFALWLMFLFSSSSAIDDHPNDSDGVPIPRSPTQASSAFRMLLPSPADERQLHNVDRRIATRGSVERTTVNLNGARSKAGIKLHLRRL